ncbi:MAG: glutathione S-transferase family protein [Hyphomicrobiaceae bacterium]
MHLTIGNKVYSSWSFRPWIMLRHLGVPFSETVIQLRDGSTKDRILKHSPSGKVPCLVDGDVTVWDSLAILEYLAERFPARHVWPADAKARALARAIAAEMHSGFQALRQACPMTITKRYQARERAPEVMADVARITAIWGEARERFGGNAQGAAAGPFLFGAFSAADAMYAPVVSRLHSYSIPLDPVSQAYVDAMRGLPAYRDWVAGAVAEPWEIGEVDEPVIENLREKKA